MPLTAPLPWPPDSSADEVESLAELKIRLTTGSLAGLTIQGLRLDVDPPDLSDIDVRDALFVGCRFVDTAVAADITRRGGSVVPVFDKVPYPTSPSTLYTPEDLAAGFAEGGFEGMYDTMVFRHFERMGGPLPGVREALAQRVHDAGIDDALADATTAWVAAHGAASVVGVMGGHAVPRGAAAYRLAASLAHGLAGTGRLVVTGGGPGVMEAANLGAYLAGGDLDQLASAIDALAVAPDFHDHDRYTAAALGVRATHPPTNGTAPSAEPINVAPSAEPINIARGGLSVPTWLYGHEPANLFAGGIAKYFSNAIREDTILRLARGGVVFAPGRAGTVQEVFQAATKAFYLSDGPSGPLVFLGADFWTDVVPISSLLRPLLAASPHGDLTGLIHITDDVSEAVGLLTGA